MFFILPYSLVAALPPKPDDLGPVLAGRDVDSTALTFDSQIDQSGSITGSPIVELFPTGETTSKGKLEDILLGYGDGNSQAELISADPSEISRCRQNPTGLNQVSSGKRRFKRQKNDQCLPDANLVKPGVVEQKVPVKDQIPGQLEDDQKPRDPGLHWAPFFQIQKPQPGRTNEGKCPNLEYQVAVCYARMRSSIVPDMSLLGGLMGMLDPVSLDRMLPLLIPCETRRRGAWQILPVVAGGNRVRDIKN